MICFSAWWSGTYGARKRTSGHWALALHWHCTIACATSHRVDPSKIGLAPFAIQRTSMKVPRSFFSPATGQVSAVCWCFLSSATGPQPTGQCGGILQNSNRIRKDLMIGSVVVGFLFVFHLGVLFYEPSIILACSNCPAPTARGLLSWKGAGHHETPQPFVPHQWGAATPSWEWFLPQLFQKKEAFTWSPAKSDWNWACRITST